MLMSLVSCDGENSLTPAQKLMGTWDIMGYSDHGIAGATTGSATFGDDGTFAVLGTVTYPGEPVDSLDVSGTYQVSWMTVTLTTPDGTGNVVTKKTMMSGRPRIIHFWFAAVAGVMLSSLARSCEMA